MTSRPYREVGNAIYVEENINPSTSKRDTGGKGIHKTIKTRMTSSMDDPLLKLIIHKKVRCYREYSKDSCLKKVQVTGRKKRRRR